MHKISKEDILKQGIVSSDIWAQLEKASLDLFALGTKMAKEQGLILVDTKYEFGIKDGALMLIDEIHTPDSSRYYILDGYTERQEKGERQKQLSKEFVREWLMENGFQGLDGQVMPEMPDDFLNLVTDRYIDLHDRITGIPFKKTSYDGIDENIQSAIVKYLEHE